MFIAYETTVAIATVCACHAVHHCNTHLPLFRSPPPPALTFQISLLSRLLNCVSKQNCSRVYHKGSAAGPTKAPSWSAAGDSIASHGRPAPCRDCVAVHLAVSDMSTFAAVNRPYGELFGMPPEYRRVAGVHAWNGRGTGWSATTNWCCSFGLQASTRLPAFVWSCLYQRALRPP